MKFTDPLHFTPKPQPPRDSWWTKPAVQTDRASFNAAATEEQSRIIGHQTFGGRKRTHNTFDGASK